MDALCHEPPALVVVAGQSNALGYTLGATDLPPHLRAPPKDVWIWDPARGAFAPLQPGANTGSPNNPGAWGPETQFAWRWRKASCARLYIVKHARGETGLAADPVQKDWSPASRGELWDAATAQLAAARQAAPAARLAAVLWMQGETDATSPAKAAAYPSNLAAFVSEVRARWGGETITIAQIDRRGAGWDQVRAGQAAVAAAPDVALVDTDAFPRQPDGVHLSAKAQVQLGDAFFAAARRFSRD